MTTQGDVPAIFYVPEGYVTNGEKLMGRHVAGASFLDAFMEHTQTDKFYVQTDNRSHAEHFLSRLRAKGRSESVHQIGLSNPRGLVLPGLAYHPGPGIAKYAWKRSFFGHAKWSLCGLNHTISTTGAMDSISDLLIAPIQPWDALICTSQAAKTSIEFLLHSQFEHLAQRTGSKYMTLPQLPVIPLGVDVSSFRFDNDSRLKAKLSVGADENTFVVLYTGRLSFHSKANPFPMYLGMESAARQLAAIGKKLLLIELGWFANEYIEKAYKQASQNLCPSVRVERLDGRKSIEREKAWASADIFCSLADNMQESFGITPVEAMAAGLPAIVSDWDGYKDTIVDGLTGFRIKTSMPDCDDGLELTSRHAFETDTYDRYSGYTSQTIAVDIPAFTSRLIELLTNDALRARMAKAGLERARTVYDWKVVIGQYEKLWRELAHLRQEAAKSKSVLMPSVWPARSDPYKMFANFPSITTQEVTPLVLNSTLNAASEQLSTYLNLSIISYSDKVMPDGTVMCELLKAIGERKACNLQDLVALFPEQSKGSLTRAVALFQKLGLVALPSQ